MHGIGSGYNYIAVDLVAQFTDPSGPTAAEFQAFLDQLGDDVDGDLGTIVVDTDCDPLVCTLRDGELKIDLVIL